MTDEPRILNDAEIDDLVEQQRVDGYLMQFDLPDTYGTEPGPTTSPQGKTPGCWLGGAPTLPAEIPWPFYSSETQDVDVPMIFLGQVDCAALPVYQERQEIPRSGTLFFFYDPIFDFEHQGEGKAIFVANDVSHLPERTPPPLPEVDYEQIQRGDYNLVEEGHLRILPRHTFSPIHYEEWDSNPESYQGEPFHHENDRAFLRRLRPLEEARDARIASHFDPPEHSQVMTHEILTLFGASTMFDTGGKRYTTDPVCIARFWKCRLWTPFEMNGSRSLHFFIEREDLITRRFEKSWTAH